MSSGNTPQPDQKKQDAKPREHLSPFTVECGDECNRQIPLDHFKMILRGRWLSSNVKCDMGQDMRLMPIEIPGIRLEITPRDYKLRIFDPLEKLPKLMAAINEAQDKIVSIKSERKLTHWEEKVYNLNEVDERWSGADLLKSVLLEIARKVYGPVPTMFVVVGSVPTKEQLLGFPGREIFDPWSNSATKPSYVDEVRQWQERYEVVERHMASAAMV